MKKVLALLLLAVPVVGQITPISRSSVSGLQGTESCVNGSSINIDSGTEYIDCTNNRVGVGTTAPATVLDVDGALQVGSGATKSTFSAVGNLNFHDGAGVSGDMTVNIGSVTVKDTSNALIEANQGNGGTRMRMWASASGGTWDVVTEDAAIIRTNSVERMRFLSTGEAGIGTSVPATVLDVNGASQFGSGATKSTFTATGRLTLNSAAGMIPSIRTAAQIDAITGVVGLVYICSDCTVPYDICVGTGTALSGFRAVVNSAINTAVPGTLVNKGCGSGN